jgi:uncharacterized SAM-binding protein YcdF (DUF218 family)
MIFFKTILIMLSFWLAGCVIFIINTPMKEPAINEKYDAIIVLTGAKGRIDAGMQLLLDKHAEHLFVSGVGKDTALKDLSKFLVSFTPEQVDSLKSSISLGHFANSTEENAIETLEWIESRNYKKILLVTSNYHMLRSLFLFKKLMPDIIITPYPLIKSPISWKLVFLEYNKFLLALIK